MGEIPLSVSLFALVMSTYRLPSSFDWVIIAVDMRSSQAGYYPHYGVFCWLRSQSCQDTSTRVEKLQPCYKVLQYELNIWMFIEGRIVCSAVASVLFWVQISIISLCAWVEHYLCHDRNYWAFLICFHTQTQDTSAQVNVLMTIKGNDFYYRIIMYQSFLWLTNHLIYKV